MFKKKSIKVLTVLALLLIVSTVGQAAGFNSKGDSYTVEYKFYDQYTNRNYDYSWEVITIPAQGSKGNTSSRPGLSNPNLSEKPSQPSRPIKPSEPSKPVEPSQPSETEKPSLPNYENKPSQPSIPNNSNLSQIELEVVRLVNIERQKNGLVGFTASNELSNVARVKSQDMSINNYFSHNSPKYGSPFDMMKSFGIQYKTAGENIAKGYQSAESVVRGWMNSSGHRANILNPSFKTIGVGAYTDSKGTIYWTQMFTN